MIPEYDAVGNLTPGIHWASWPEIVGRFGTSEHRMRLLHGLRRALIALKTAGCRVAYLDGSFVTTKRIPGDFDGCWEEEQVDLDILDPVLQTFANARAAQKAKYGGEFFPATQIETLSMKTFLQFFQEDKNTGEPKGIIAIDLGSFEND